MAHGGVRPPDGCEERQPGTLIRCRLADGHEPPCAWPTPARPVARCCPDMDLRQVVASAVGPVGDWRAVVVLALECCACRTPWRARVIDRDLAEAVAP